MHAWWALMHNNTYFLLSHFQAQKPMIVQSGYHQRIQWASKHLSILFEKFESYIISSNILNFKIHFIIRLRPYKLLLVALNSIVTPKRYA